MVSYCRMISQEQQSGTGFPLQKNSFSDQVWHEYETLCPILLLCECSFDVVSFFLPQFNLSCHIQDRWNNISDYVQGRCSSIADYLSSLTLPACRRSDFCFDLSNCNFFQTDYNCNQSHCSCSLPDWSLCKSDCSCKIPKCNCSKPDCCYRLPTFSLPECLRPCFVRPNFSLPDCDIKLPGRCCYRRNFDDTVRTKFCCCVEPGYMLRKLDCRCLKQDVICRKPDCGCAKPDCSCIKPEFDIDCVCIESVKLWCEDTYSCCCDICCCCHECFSCIHRRPSRYVNNGKRLFRHQTDIMSAPTQSQLEIITEQPS